MKKYLPYLITLVIVIVGVSVAMMYVMPAVDKQKIKTNGTGSTPPAPTNGATAAGS